MASISRLSNPPNLQSYVRHEQWAHTHTHTHLINTIFDPAVLNAWHTQCQANEILVSSTAGVGQYKESSAEHLCKVYKVHSNIIMLFPSVSECCSVFHVSRVHKWEMRWSNYLKAVFEVQRSSIKHTQLQQAIYSTYASEVYLTLQKKLFTGRYIGVRYPLLSTCPFLMLL